MLVRVEVEAETERKDLKGIEKKRKKIRKEGDLIVIVVKIVKVDLLPLKKRKREIEADRRKKKVEGKLIENLKEIKKEKDILVLLELKKNLKRKENLEEIEKKKTEDK